MQEVLSNPALPGADQARLWATPILGGVEATLCRFINHRFTPHTHDQLMIGLIEKGTKVFDRDGRRHFVGPGGMSIVNPGEAHTGARAEGEELHYRAIYVDVRILNRRQPIELRPPSVVDPDVFKACWAATAAIMSRAEGLICEERLLRAIALLAHRYSHSQSCARRPGKEVSQARDFLADRYASDDLIETISKVVGLSPYHLMRSFRRAFGMPMHAYRLGARIDRVKDLLRRSDENLAEIALDCGFADQSAMSRRFKAQTGLSPAAYRRAFLA